MSDCLTYMIISLLWLCMLSYAWMRERKEKKEKEEKMINREDQISELTFNFHGALSTSAFLKWASHIHQEKQKKEKKRRKRKIEVKRGERKKRKKREKSFVWAPMSEKSILCDLVKTYLLIPLFTN